MDVTPRSLTFFVEQKASCSYKRLMPLSHFILTFILLFSGIYGIRCEHYHEEDMDYCDTSEGIPHYVMFNAGTGYFNLYPEALVLTAEDRLDVPRFLEKLTQPPYLLRFRYSNVAAESVRRLMFVIDHSTSELPYSHPSSLAGFI